MKISLVIPVRNEEKSIKGLLKSIDEQTIQPEEIILVDGGSTDQTVQIIEKLAQENNKIKIVKVADATPGKGRNIGTENAKNDWIAFTDAGIELDKNWLKYLSEFIESNPATDVVYGNCKPIVKTFFEKCATVAYFPPQKETSKISMKSIASCLLKKTVWQQIGGFPNLRSAEDLIFMEEVEKQNFQIGIQPNAMIYWQLRPDFLSTFRRFVLYSTQNALIGRTWDWHYGVARQYLFALPFILLAILHSKWWLLIIVGWLFARTTKKILGHRREFGLNTLFNPLIFLYVLLLIVGIDIATFVGWGKAILEINLKS